MADKANSSLQLCCRSAGIGGSGDLDHDQQVFAGCNTWVLRLFPQLGQATSGSPLPHHGCVLVLSIRPSFLLDFFYISRRLNDFGGIDFSVFIKFLKIRVFSSVLLQNPPVGGLMVGKLEDVANQPIKKASLRRPFAF